MSAVTRVAPVLVLAALLSAAGCSDNPTAPTSAVDTTPVTTPVNVTFPGVVGPNGTVSRSFVAQLAGTASVTVSSISPATPLGIGIGIPRADGTGCLLAVSSTASNGNSASVSTSVPAGSFCVQVFAPAQSASAVNFSVALTHP